MADMTDKVSQAMAAFDALSPEEQAEHRKAQQESWVRGEMAMKEPAGATPAGIEATAELAHERAAPAPVVEAGLVERLRDLLTAEDDRQTKLHDLLETIREQIRLEVAPEQRPEGLMTNIQNAVYAMRGRTRLMDDAALLPAIASALSSLQEQVEALMAQNTQLADLAQQYADQIEAGKDDWAKHGGTEIALGQWKAACMEAREGCNQRSKTIRSLRRHLEAAEADNTRLRQHVEDMDAALVPSARDVLAERQRQIDVEGFDRAHDTANGSGELARAAACYALGDPGRWPWDREWWKPKDRRSNLVRSGALILAEIDRLDRRARKEPNNV